MLQGEGICMESLVDMIGPFSVHSTTCNKGELGMYPDPGFNLGHLGDRQILYHLSHQGSSRKCNSYLMAEKKYMIMALNIALYPEKRLKLAYGSGYGKGENL